jgi:cell division protein FtsL
VLLFAVCVSALYLIELEYEARTVHMQSYKALKEERALEVERQKLIAKRSAFVSPLRVENKARESLDMVDISPLSTHFAIGVLNAAKAKVDSGVQVVKPDAVAQGGR